MAKLKDLTSFTGFAETLGLRTSCAQFVVFVGKFSGRCRGLNHHEGEDFFGSVNMFAVQSWADRSLLGN